MMEELTYIDEFYIRKMVKLEEKIVRNMLEYGMDVDTIVEATKISRSFVCGISLKVLLEDKIAALNQE